MQDPFTQVKLIKKQANNSELQEIVWIPTAFAKLGKYLKIKQDDGSWVDGWQVSERFATKEGKYIKEHERNYLKQREASDI